VVDGPNLNGMEQVKEILTLLDHKMIDGVCVATNFIFQRIQPSKESMHPEYEFRGRPIVPMRFPSR
jgi:hypothetical protein